VETPTLSSPMPGGPDHATPDPGSRGDQPLPGEGPPLRILHLVESFGGGTLEVVRSLSGHLATAGHDVAVAHGARRETPADARAGLHPAVEVFPLPWRRRTPRAQLAAARALRRLVREWKPDLVHLHSSFAGLVGATVLGGTGVTLVYTPHAYTFTMLDKPAALRRLFALLERFVARRVSVVGAVSASEAQLAREVARAPSVAVVENGIPELDGEPRDRAERKRALVVATGRATPQRQPEACARILSAIADIAELEWLGGGDPRSPEVAALRRAGIALTGWIDRDEVMDTLAEATVYLHWSAWDGAPLAILEAIAADAIVVASDIAANRELIGPDQTCASETEAATLIRRLLEDEGLRSRLLTAQRERRGRHGSIRMASGWLELYTEAIGLDGAAVRSTGRRTRVPRVESSGPERP